MATPVLKRDILQGTITTACVPVPTGPQTIKGALDLPPEEQADPAKTLRLTLQVDYGYSWGFSASPDNFSPVATAVWQGGPTAPAPSVTWTGQAKRARLVIDTAGLMHSGACIGFPN
jgi:hypothetical protein